MGRVKNIHELICKKVLKTYLGKLKLINDPK